MNQPIPSAIEMLLVESFHRELDPPERDQLNKWLERSPENREVYRHMARAWRTRYADPVYIHEAEMREKILKEGLGTTRPASLQTWLRVAAILVVGLLLGLFLWGTWDTSEPVKLAETEWITRENAPGVKSKLILSDSSVVWLNAESKIRYVRGFTDSLRMVQLDGEAFFEVKKDADRPFIVRTSQVTTRALGTSFNIRHYPEEADTRISLLTGKVEIVATDDPHEQQLFYLIPNEYLTVPRDHNNITKDKINDHPAAWKDNILEFRNASFPRVIRSLERWYGVSIDTSYLSRKRSWDYVATFENESLERVLSRIGYTHDFEFTISGKQVIIYNTKP